VEKSGWVNTQLFRPAGLYELRLICESGYTAFPPRLPEQPIFYPVLNQAYAEQIARDWNMQDERSGFMGAVTAFDVDDGYLAQFEAQTVGAAQHRELWVPAERLDEFNQHVIGGIRVLSAFYGTDFSGEKEW
jgi:hypothetical protein